jgi:hypothetical protein
MPTTHSIPALPHRAQSGTARAGRPTHIAGLALIAAVAALAISSAPVSTALVAPAGAAEQLKQSGAKKRALKPNCPAKFAAKCNKYQRVVCVQNDSRGCCTKSICQ